MSIIEQETMLGAAKYGPSAGDYSAIPRFLWRPRGLPGPGETAGASRREDLKIWHFEHAFPAQRDAAGKANEIRNLTCSVEANGYMPMVVCDSIKWSDVLITIRPGEKPIALTLTNHFLISQRFLSDGEINDSISDCVSADPAEYWRPLPQKIDVAFELVFGFRFDAAKKSYKAVPLEAIRNGDIKSMAVSSKATAGEGKQAGSQPGKTNSTNAYRLTPNDVVVTISLVCCKQSWRFTPDLPKVFTDDLLKDGPSPLGVARFFPLTYVTPHFQIHKIETRTRIVRPPMVHHHPHPAPDLVPFYSMRRPGGFVAPKKSLLGTDSKMLGSYSAGVYADHNFPLDIVTQLRKGAQAVFGDIGQVAPLWNLTFSHYHTAPAVNRDYLVVLPRRVANWDVPLKTTSAKALGEWDPATQYDNNRPPAPNCNNSRFFYQVANYEGSKSDLWKRPGQGLFDNVHLAPLMADPYADATANSRGFGAISMAPFCVHDCLHTHWRWLSEPTTWPANALAGKESVGKWNYGWSDDGKPYSAPGCTMVPPDQMIAIRLERANGSPTTNAFTYIAESLNPKNNHTSIFFHHGSAYAAMIHRASSLIAFLVQPSIFASGDPGVRAIQDATDKPIQVPAYVSWARFYWALRYDFVNNKVRERIKVPDWNAMLEIPDLKAINQASTIQPAVPDPGMGGPV